MKIRVVEDELLHADGQTDVTKLMVAFRIFATIPNKSPTLWSNSLAAYRRLQSK